MFFFYLLLFIIWPFFAFVFALFKCESRLVKMLVVVGFTAIMGANIFYEDVTGDAVQYARFFIEDATYGVNFMDFISQGRIDILLPLSNLFVAQFTMNPRILLSLYGLLYGLLIYLSLSKAYNLILGEYSFVRNKMQSFSMHDNRISVIFILVMIYFVNPMTHMGTFRFFFSTWLFFYGWLVYTEGQKRLGTVFMLITPLIHTTFIIPLLIFVIHKYIPIPTKMLFWGVILCFIIGQVLYVQDYMQEISFITDSEKYEGYIQYEEYEKRMEMAERRSIINDISQIVYKYVFFGIVLSLYPIINRFIKEGENSKVVYLYNFVLLYCCFAYLFLQVPSMGRFSLLANMFLLFVVGVLISMEAIQRKRLLLIFVSLAMLGQIYLSLYPNNVGRFDLKYLFPIFYL